MSRQTRPSKRSKRVVREVHNVSETGADGPVVTLSDDMVTLRPWLRDDARFMAEASADPAIRRYNGVLDRLGRPTPPLSTTDAEAVIDEFALELAGVCCHWDTIGCCLRNHGCEVWRQWSAAVASTTGLKQT